VAAAVNVTFSGPKPSLPVAVAVVIVGARLAVTVTARAVAGVVPPLPSLAVTTTLYVPAVVNVCVTFCVVPAAVPSPKFHE